MAGAWSSVLMILSSSRKECSRVIPSPTLLLLPSDRNKEQIAEIPLSTYPEKLIRFLSKIEQSPNPTPEKKKEKKTPAAET